jgi:hypothetical protein
MSGAKCGIRPGLRFAYPGFGRAYPLRIDLANLLSGLIFVAIGGAFAGTALVDLPIGTAREMGPGMFPLALATILIALGLLIVAQGWGRQTLPAGTVSWRGMVLILAAPILFGVLMGGLGLAPTVFIGVTVACFASRHMTLPRALAIAGGLAALCWLVFRLGLGVAVPTFGRWLGV